MPNIGKIVWELLPSPGNSRNSEGAFYTLDNGDILFVYSKFIGEGGRDDAYSAIARRVSGDNGETWSDETILFKTEEHDTEKENAKNIMSVSFLPMQNGDIGLFYLVRMGWHDTRLHLRRSSDGGRTWGEAAACIPAPGYFVTNNDRVVRHSSGRILVPANLHRMKIFDNIGHAAIDGRGIPCVFYSDDDGFSWAESQTYSVPYLPASVCYMQESGIIEKQNSSLYMWMRTDVGCQYESCSTDEGLTWTLPSPSRFTSPDSPLSMKRIPGSGKLLAVWNPIPNYNGRDFIYRYGGRTPLVCAVSADDGRTWGDLKTIEDDPDAGYCYTAIHFTRDGHVLLCYCSGGLKDDLRSCLHKLTIRKIPLIVLD